MINNPVIVGCGTVGATLALKLSERKLIHNLKICDCDIVSSVTSSSIYPFNSDERNISKVQILKFLIKKNYPDIDVSAFEHMVYEPFYTSEFIIDCRDCNIPFINHNMKLSMDGCLLYVDCRKKQDNIENHRKYVYPRNVQHINKAIDIIVDLLLTDKYSDIMYRLYDLEKGEYYTL
jgi:hypothetical protein